VRWIIRYASIRKQDISNGEGIGISVFVQGCHLHCHNCFNSEAWDFEGGKEWNEAIRDTVIKLADKLSVVRLSILGGEPLADENAYEVYSLIWHFKDVFPDKQVWLYSGYTWGEVMDESQELISERGISVAAIRCLAVTSSDILVDGRYVDELRDFNLKWCGSSNQRVIDVKRTLSNEQGEIVLYKPTIL